MKMKRTMRRACLGGAAAIGGTALVLTTLPVFAADTADPAVEAICEVEILPGESGTGAGQLKDIDPTGSYAVGHISKDFLYEAAIWEDGELTTLFDDEHSESQVVAVNSDGLAVGYGVFDESEGPEGFAYVDGETVKIAKPEGYPRIKITDINDDGTIVGYASNPDRDDHPFLWESYDAEPTALPMPDEAFQARAKSISEEGRVAGDYAEGAATNTWAYVWETDGSATALEYDGRVNGDGIEGDWIIGHSPVKDSYNTAVRWNGVEAEPEDVDFHNARDINAQGDLVGNYGAGVITQRAAKLTADDKLYMLPFPGTATNSTATAVGTDGLTIGGVVEDTEAEEGSSPYQLPALWHCEE